MKNIVEKAFKLHELSNKEICGILSSDEFSYLTEKANQMREKNIGDSVQIRGLLQISNLCAQNCLYCENRKDNPKERYTLSATDIVNISKEFSKTGIRNIIFQSGETTAVSTDSICEIIGKLKVYNINVFPSLGERNEGEYRMLKAAGAEQVILNLITSSFTLFGELHPEMNLMGRVLALRFMKANNIKTGSGILVGFPNQTFSSLADDILDLKNLNVGSIEIIPFIPKQNTLLKEEAAVNIDKILKVTAIIRLLMPGINISVSENICEIDPHGMLKTLQSGADTLIINLTDIDCSKKEIDINSLKEHLLSINRNC